MPTFERSIEIDAPVEAVFSFHLDTRNVPLITPPSQEITDIEGDFPLVVGAEVEMRIRQAPIPTAQPWRIRITELIEPTLLVDELIEGGFERFVHTHRFAPTPSGGTILTDHIDWEMPPGIAGRIATPVAAGIIEKTFAARQDKLKVLLEADA